MRKNKPWVRREPLQKTRTCHCGGTTKLISRRNFPFGRKSNSVLTRGYVCSKCRTLTLLNKDRGGKK